VAYLAFDIWFFSSRHTLLFLAMYIRFLLFLMLFLGFFSACSSFSNQEVVPSARVLRHVVLFKFKDGTPPEQLRAIEQAFLGLKKQLPELVSDIEFGTNNSPEPLSGGLTHCFLVTFPSEEARAAYLPHPVHQAFVDQYVKPHVDKVTVVDYWNQ
jgi:Stress responsive A/B Barrel Domain